MILDSEETIIDVGSVVQYDADIIDGDGRDHVIVIEPVGTVIEVEVG